MTLRNQEDFDLWALPLHSWRGTEGEASEGRPSHGAQGHGGGWTYDIISQYPPTTIAAAENEARSAW